MRHIHPSLKQRDRPKKFLRNSFREELPGANDEYLFIEYVNTRCTRGFPEERDVSKQHHVGFSAVGKYLLFIKERLLVPMFSFSILPRALYY